MKEMRSSIARTNLIPVRLLEDGHPQADVDAMADEEQHHRKEPRHHHQQQQHV